MKIYNYLISALLVGSIAGFSSCKNEEEDIFDASAAQRLDEYKRQYSAELTADGGKWLMEYFANEEEGGYAFVMTFNTDGSVRISGQNTWLGHSYKSEVSLWQIIADNGPVLSFNTYNNVFHIMSDPANITGPDAPVNPDQDNRDIDETGTGHGGDYEFVIIGLSEDGKTMHLSGKKRLHDIYMRRLEPSVDEIALLSSYEDAAQKTFSNLFPEMLLTDTQSGEQFVFKGGVKGLFDAWPKDGDPVVQTVSMNALVGPDNIRFRVPFAIERANPEDSIVVENLVRQDDGTFLCTDNGKNLVLDNIGYGNIFTNDKFVWKTKSNTLRGGVFDAVYEKIKTETSKNLKKTFRGLEWKYVNAEKTFVLRFDMSGNAAVAYIYGKQEIIDNGNSVKFNISTTDGNTNGKKRLSQLPSLVEFIELLNSTTFVIESDRRFAPSTMKFIDANNPENYIIFAL